jgi:hypothetical protein
VAAVAAESDALHLIAEASSAAAASTPAFGDNAFRCDCLLERGGLEPPRPFRIREAEFNPSLAHYSARIKASMLERICSPWIRLFFGALRFPSFTRLTRGSW